MTNNLDKKHLPFGHSTAIQDPDALETLKNIELDLVTLLADEHINEEFCNNYLEWINSGTLNSITGLDQFKFKSYSNGTSEAFDKFYIKNRTRRFRCFKGEYVYHQLAWRNSWPDWKFIEDAPVDTNDAVVISLPFADTGVVHTQMFDILEQCTKLKIPVLLDCAYFGICSNTNFNFNFDCITDITFSLSKFFPVSHARIGMRLTRIDDDDLLFVYNKNLYLNRIGAKIGLEFISRYNPDYIIKKYKLKQQELCQVLDVCPSDTILFGLSATSWQEYNRGGSTNRLGLHKYLHRPITELINDLQSIHS